MPQKQFSFLIVLSLLTISVWSQICLPSQFYNGQRCASCKANCICTVQNKCDDCLPGYAFDATFSNCLQCPQLSNSIDIGCAQCCSQISGTQFVCSSCAVQPYVFLRGGQCFKLQGCTTLTNAGLCSACSSGYYFLQGKCSACDSSCATCYDSTLCLTCNNGFYNGTNIDHSLCQACPIGCSGCTSSISCTACISGYRFSSPNCISCGDVNCLSCSPTACTTCLQGTTLITGSCYLCTDSGKSGTNGCQVCSTSIGNTITCTKCADSYYLNAGMCYLCTSTFANSYLCNNTNVIQCSNDYVSTYSSRYYLMANTCVANTKNCKVMKNVNGDCSSCYFEAPDNYYKLNGLQCTKCILAGCASFSTTCQCLSCQNGYRFINNLCSACQNLHCNQCQLDVQSCEACESGYGLISSACILCMKSNCNNCDGDYTKCAICNTGYYISSGSCYSCQTNCVSCSSSINCSSCQPGYYLQSNGRCKILPLNCLEVDPYYLGSSVAVCKKCSYGYQVLSGNCYPCSESLLNLGQCQKYCPNYYVLLKFQVQLHYSAMLFFLAIIYLVLF